MATDEQINAVLEGLDPPPGAGEGPVDSGEPTVPAVVLSNEREGAPLLDRLAGAFKFDERGLENYLIDTYGRANVLRGDDGSLHFLPPDQLELPEKDRRWIRFNPEGLDVGDIIEVVPAALGALGGIGAAWLSGGTSVPITLGALFGGGAVGEAAVQGVGAVIPGEDPGGTVGARAQRMATSGAIEAATGGLGMVAKKVGPRIAEGLSEGARRTMQRVVRTGSKPAQVAEREALGRRVGVEFSEGQLAGTQPALMAERFARQNVFSSQIVKEADEEAVNALGRYAQRTIDSLGTEPFEVGVSKAVKAHTNHIEALVDKRRELTKPLFDLAKKAFGKDRVVPINNARKRLAALAEELDADITTDDAKAAAKWIAEKLEDIPGDKVSVTSLQNMLSEWGKASVDPRGVIAQVQSYDMKKRVAREFFHGLRADLDEAAESFASVINEGVTGQFRSGRLFSKAVNALKEARSVYREFSEAITKVADNPLADLVDDPRKLGELFLSQNPDPTKARQIMAFLQETAPGQADELRSSVIQEMMRRASRGNIDEPFSPALLRNIADKAKVQLDALFAGNSKAKSAFNDMVSASRLLANQGSLQGSQTAPLQLINLMLDKVGLPVVALSALKDESLADSGGEAAAIAALIFAPRWLAKAMMHPPAAKAYAKVMTAAARPKLSKGAAAAVRQAIADIVTFGDRLDKTERGPRQDPSVTRRILQFIPAGP